MAIGPEPAGAADHPRAGGDRRRAVRLAVAGLAVVLAVIFIAQNNDTVEFTFLAFEVTTRVWVGMLVTLVLGALLGQAVEALYGRRRRR
ncbi:MAG TPA: LapA family protein [Acidimicrobiales bacterium]